MMTTYFEDADGEILTHHREHEIRAWVGNALFVAADLPTRQLLNDEQNAVIDREYAIARRLTEIAQDDDVNVAVAAIRLCHQLKAELAASTPATKLDRAMRRSTYRFIQWNDPTARTEF